MSKKLQSNASSEQKMEKIIEGLLADNNDNEKASFSDGSATKK